MADPSAALYWLETWNAQISTVVGAFASLCGVFALFAAGVSCKLAGLLQIATGLLVVAIEGPNFLPQLAFAAPVGAMLEGKPSWIKVSSSGMKAEQYIALDGFSPQNDTTRTLTRTIEQPIDTPNYSLKNSSRLHFMQRSQSSRPLPVVLRPLFWAS